MSFKKSTRICVQLTTILTLLATHVHGQIMFEEHSQLLSNQSFYGYLTKGVCDINGDGLDDIVRSYPTTLEDSLRAYTGLLEILYQTESGSFRPETIGQPSELTQLSMAIGDLDNDGDLDILTGGWYDGVHVFINEGEKQFLIHDLMTPRIAMQGSSLGDIDNDGLLDYFACNDEGLSQIWMNNGQNELHAVDNVLDLRTTPTSDNSGNYGSVWTDFDDDGDLDLYISKCSVYARDDATDPRRINVLYVNDGNGNYEEMAVDYGLSVGAQSWSTEFFDMDNDGDLDCYVSNHYEQSQLFENIDNMYFEDITDASGIGEVGNSLQCLARDFDNDGNMDLLLSGIESHMLRNRGGGKFEKIENELGLRLDSLRSFAVGDFNNDGFVDIYGTYHFTEFTNIIGDKLWFNTPNNNNYIKLKLEGTQSNKSGIGAKIKVYIDNQIHVREVRAGESYGISNSLRPIIGIGDKERVDSLVVSWPSGEHTVLHDIEINKETLIKEENDIVDSVPLEWHSDWALYPNPVSQDWIKLEGVEQKETLIEIYDLTGKRRHIERMKGDSFIWNLQGLNQGFYEVVLKNTTGLTIGKKTLIRL